MAALLLATLSPSPSTAHAQTADEQPAETPDELENADALLRSIQADTAPDGSEDYAEIHHMRVLERTFLSADSLNPRDALPTLPHGDPMQLSRQAAMHLLVNASNAGESSPGLQRQSSRLMADALQHVQTILHPNRGKKLDLPFGLECLEESAVQEYLALYAAPSARTIKIWLVRAGQWRPMIEKIMKEEGLPEDLLYLAMIESGFKTRAKSPAAAAGMWQFIPSTGAEMGLRIDQWVDERYDPIKSTYAAAQYLKRQFARYQSWPLAMAAYNGGPGTVNIAIDRYNTTNYFKLVEYGAMYDETRRYVPKILAAAIIGKNPEAFGFAGLIHDPPLAFDTVTVPPATPLSVLAKAAGCDLQTLQTLNPELLRDQTPPDGNYHLRIPLDAHDSFVKNFDNPTKNYPTDQETISLRFGQTIEHLADQIGVPVRVLRSLNGLGDKDIPAYGTDIVVPKNRKQTTPETKSSPLIALTPPADFKLPNKRRVFYQTQRSDRLEAIAQALSVTPTELALWNDLDLYARLRPGLVLQAFVAPKTNLDHMVIYEAQDVQLVDKGSAEHRALFAPRASTPATRSSSTTQRSAPAPNKDITHTVVKGDSLSKIAKKYDVSVQDIQKWNNLKANSAIRTGQKLIIKR